MQYKDCKYAPKLQLMQMYGIIQVLPLHVQSQLPVVSLIMYCIPYG